jgi:hypothetical protein
MNTLSIPQKTKKENPTLPDLSFTREPLVSKLASLIEETLRPNRKGIAAQLGLSVSTINSGLSFRPPRFSIFNLPLLLIRTGDFRILFWLCRLCGYQAVRLPEVTGQGDTTQALNDLLVVLGGLQKSAGDYVARSAVEQKLELLKQLSWVIAGAVRAQELLERINGKK